MKKNSIAVIIPVKNEEKTLPKLLESLFKQSLQPDEVIIIDAGSNDSTWDIILSFQKKHPQIVAISSPGALPGKARNEGIKISQSKIVAHIDAGIYIALNWLEMLVKPILDGEIDYTFGSVEPVPNVVTLFNFKFDLAILYESIYTCTYRSEQVVCGGASVAYKKYIWDLAGGQPDWLRRGEDQLYVRKVKSLGIKTRYADTSVCYWLTCPSIKIAIERKLHYTLSDFKLPFLTDQLKAISSRFFLLCLIIIASFTFPLIGVVLLLLLAVDRFRVTYKSLKKYSKMAKSAEILPPFISFPLISSISMVLFILEQFTFVIGLFMRYFQFRDSINKAKRYLGNKKFQSDPV